ncbi:hypothetical protein BE25_0061 [Staphylococcus phage vB_SepM_BE25]|nr:putative membrane protein [Staphylococcus phage Twillingate]WEU70547.1 hypothetical protein BE25_0061 [Staphylococcus phage vB_SepM_BE25]
MTKLPNNISYILVPCEKGYVWIFSCIIQLTSLSFYYSYQWFLTPLPLIERNPL